MHSAGLTYLIQRYNKERQMIKRRIKFDNGSRAIDVVGVAGVGMLYLNVYWIETDEYGERNERLRCTTNYMTPTEARIFSDLLMGVADEVES